MRDTVTFEAYVSKAKECEKERMFTSSLKGPWAWTPYQPA